MSEKERDIGDEILAEYDRLTQEAYDEGTMPEDETAGDWNVEQMEIAENTILSEEEQEVVEQEVVEQEVVEQEASEEDSDSDGSLTYDDGFQEYEDWDDAGGVYQDGGEAYDNFDWNALD